MTSDGPSSDGFRDLPTVTADNPKATPAFPERIGRYHIKRVIASGGMGTVYEATQDNPRRVVAVKVMKQGIASKSALRRFEYEGQILGRLRHPGIAQIYEAGTHHDPAESGAPVPYFAMEYIPNAKTITRYADEKKLGTRQRMELFARVYDAIHHGHQKGIIHRDLKPSNILVDSTGQVKIIDFGVARCTDSDLAVTTLQTDVGQLIGTLQYMSPEQCEGDPHDIDTRSDAYALGVVFYQLLSGSLPYDVTRMAMHQATRAIREQHPTKLSTLNHTLRGDVETIALKALEKERERRYQSAADFAHDIHRYLTGEAILARRASIIYQLRLFARRNKGVFASLAAVFIVLVAGTIVSTSLYLRAEHARVEQTRERERAELAEGDQSRERQRAEQEAQTSRQVTEFLVSLFEVSDPSESRGNTITAREILDKGAVKIRQELNDQPVIQGALMNTMGRVYTSLGLFDGASPLAESALTLRRATLGPKHPDVAASLHDLGVLRRNQGRYVEAESLIREALVLRKEVLGELNPAVARSMADLSQALGNLGQLDASMDLGRQVLALRRKLHGEEHPAVAEAMQDVAHDLMFVGNLDEAKRMFQEALAIRRRVSGDDNVTATILHNLAAVAEKEGNMDRAEQFQRESVAIARKVLGDDHPDSAFFMNKLATILSNKGNYSESEELFRETLRIERATLPEGHYNTTRTLSGFALLMLHRGDTSDAETLIQECLELLQKHQPTQTYFTTEAESILGAVRTAQRRFEEAEPLLVRSYPIVSQQPGPIERVEALQRMIDLYESWDAAEPGKGYAEKASQWRAKLGEKSKSQNAETPQ